jgi:putative ABC transport system substrate-binding protein
MEMDRASSSRSPEPTRRAFIAIVAGGLLSTPLPARAQPDGKVHRIGILGNVPVSDSDGARLWGAFTDALRRLGYVEGRNLRIEHLSSEGRYDRLPALAAELVRRQVDVIVAPAAQNVMAVRQASRTIPIVMVSVGDPEASGLVASLSRPGGNVTGTSFITSVMVEKQLELLTQIAPRAERPALLLNPANPGHPITLEKAVPPSRRADHPARRPGPPARDVRATDVRGSWRAGMLRTVRVGELSWRRRLRRHDLQGGEAR